jgi:hypothetical protein
MVYVINKKYKNNQNHVEIKPWLRTKPKIMNMSFKINNG